MKVFVSNFTRIAILFSYHFEDGLIDLFLRCIFFNELRRSRQTPKIFINIKPKKKIYELKLKSSFEKIASALNILWKSRKIRFIKMLYYYISSATDEFNNDFLYIYTGFIAHKFIFALNYFEFFQNAAELKNQKLFSSSLHIFKRWKTLNLFISHI